METKSKYYFIITLLILICAGVWVLVLQNAGIISTEQIVIVKNGNIRAAVNGTVSVENQVDINVSAINGKENVFYDFGGNGDYIRIPVMTTYPSGF